MLTAALSAAPAPVCSRRIGAGVRPAPGATSRRPAWWSAEDWIEAEVRGRSEEHTSELQSHVNLVCRLLLEKKNRKSTRLNSSHMSISYAVFCLKKKNRV